jgi:putative DNA primase/helicase
MNRISFPYDLDSLLSDNAEDGFIQPTYERSPEELAEIVDEIENQYVYTPTEEEIEQFQRDGLREQDSLYRPMTYEEWVERYGEPEQDNPISDCSEIQETERRVLHNGATIENRELETLFERVLELNPQYDTFNYSRDDIGTANLFSEAYDNDIRYCPQNKSWYIWDNHRWVRQIDDGVVSERMQQLLNLLKLYIRESRAELDESDEKEMEIWNVYEKYINSIRKNIAMKHILELVKTNLRIQITEFDTQPTLLNTSLGTIDLSCGKQHKANRDEYITLITNASPLTPLDSPCERWYQFIDEIMDGNKEKAKFLQRALGYSLLGANEYECFFVAFGEKARNGKGTLFEAVRNVLGEYANTGKPEMICELRNGKSIDYNSPQPVLASYTNTRYLTMSEVPIDAVLDASTVKSLTGRDMLKTRGLYEAPFEYMPQFTIWLMVNHLPMVRDDTIFLSRRLWVIYFNKHYSEKEADVGLKSYFMQPENQRTIMSWLLDGYADYKKNGLAPPQCVRDDTAKYHKMSDRIGSFIEDCCKEDEDAQTIRGQLYNAYCRWCMGFDRKYKPIGSTEFYNEIMRRGYRILKNSDWVVQGLKIGNPQRIIL